MAMKRTKKNVLVIVAVLAAALMVVHVVRTGLWVPFHWMMAVDTLTLNRSTTFYGQLCDDHGHPIAGADVTVLVASGSLTHFLWTGSPQYRRQQVVRTGADGRFSFRATGYLVGIDKVEAGPAYWSLFDSYIKLPPPRQQLTWQSHDFSTFNSASPAVVTVMRR